MNLGKNLYVLEVNRREVVAKDIRRLEKTLKMLDENGYGSNSLVFFYHGYDNDKREIFEIPEIIQWAKIVHHKIPHIYYYLKRDMEEGLNNFLSLVFQYKFIHFGEKLNAYEIHERGLQGLQNIQIHLKLPNRTFENMKAKMIKHANKNGGLDDVHKTIEYIEKLTSK